MGKGTNFSGQPVLSQLIKLMDRQKINTLASKSGADYYTKHLDGYSHLIVMLYAVLSNLRSLREVCLGFAANAIEIQIWVTMIAYLLLRVMQAKSMSKLAFSNIVMLTEIWIRPTITYGLVACFVTESKNECD